MQTSNFRITIYNIFIHLILPYLIIRLFYKSIKSPNYRKRFLERFGIFKLPNFSNECIWLHAVSVGESVASFPIIKKLQEDFPDTPIVVTTTTPTGSDRVLQSLKDSVFHVYMPYDVPFAINNFIKKLKPKKLILMETELWPNLLHICKQKDINSYLINARLSDKSTNGYLNISGISNYMLECLNHICAQYEHDAKNFLKLGASKDKVSIVGNIKFDINPPADKISLGNKLKATLHNKFVICVASTHSGEEQIILETYKKIVDTIPNTLLILVPRHPERFNEVAKLIDSFKFNFAIRSKSEVVTENTQILYGDTMGELMQFFAASDLAFIGGSLHSSLGGHNMLEPASVNVPVITGTNLRNFKAIASAMQAADALVVVEDEKELFLKLQQLIKDDSLRDKLVTNSKNFLAKNKGAVENICTRIA